LYVSDLGMLRTDVHGARLFSHDGASWLGCLDECPPASGKRACIPYIAQTSVSVDPPAECKVEQEQGAAWHGYPTQLTRWTCSDGRRLEVVAVPELAAVRDALISVGFLKAGSSLATREGLPVVARVDHWPQFFEITAIEEMSCDSWDYPEGYALYTDPERFDRLKELAGPLRSAVDLSLKRQTDELQGVVNERLIAEIGRRCLGERESYAEADVQQCVKDKPEIHPEVEALKRTAKDKLTQAVMERGQERARIELSEGLCKELAK
jgi:hypothetical protein